MSVALKSIKRRILITSLGFVVFLGLILLRSYQLQIADNARVHRLTEKQYFKKMPVEAKRGTIYDRNGKVLAMDLEVSSIGVHPAEIKDPHATAKALQPFLKIPEKKILEKIESNKKFDWVARRIQAEDGHEIEKLKLKGIRVEKEYRRFYPNRELAGQVLGAVGYDAKALGGVELMMDDVLKSQPTKMFAERDAKGRLITPVDELVEHHDVHLTLDSNLQYAAEKYLHETGAKTRAKHGFAIVLDPKTNEVLAMANYPSFNPNVYWEYPMETWKNHAVVSSFEPGSTFKAVAAASAITSNKVHINDVFNCENGTYAIGKRVIHDHHPYASLALADIIRVSSNIGVTKVVQKIGRQTFYDTLKNLGFGQKTGVDLPGEVSGFVASVKRWGDLDTSNIAFGQGLVVNGIQMASSYSTFANGGVLMKPFIVSKVTDAQGNVVKENQSTLVRKVMEQAQAEEVTAMLETVTHPDGTGKLAKVQGYTVAGKTGTAQKVNPKTKQYDKDEYVSSFIGYVPANQPQFVIYVVYDAPRPVYAGGLIAAPVFQKIAQEALVYRGVAPTEHAQVAKLP